MLAVVYALEKFNQFTFGRHVTVHSNHKPLEAILKKPLACAPKRLQGMIMRLEKYDLEVRYEKGTEMHIADFLSHTYLSNTEHPSGAYFEQVNMASFLPISDQRLQEIRIETEKDDTLQILKCVILQGWPTERHEEPAQVTPYYSVHDELAVQEGLIQKSESRHINSPLCRHEAESSLITHGVRVLPKTCTRIYLLARHGCRNQR